MSAGSDIAGRNFPRNLGLLNATLETHADTGSPVGPAETGDGAAIRITDNQAVLIDGDRITVIE